MPFHPDSVTSKRGREKVGLAQAEAEMFDGFASFIDKMIQQLPYLLFLCGVNCRSNYFQILVMSSKSYQPVSSPFLQYSRMLALLTETYRALLVVEVAALLEKNAEKREFLKFVIDL